MMERPKEVKMKKDWEQDAVYDVDTLIRAQEILGDSKRVKYAKAEIVKRNKAVDKAAAQLEVKTEGRLKKLFNK